MAEDPAVAAYRDLVQKIASNSEDLRKGNATAYMSLNMEITMAYEARKIVAEQLVDLQRKVKERWLAYGDQQE